MTHTFRFAEKPGVIPGKPITIGTINDCKRVARIVASNAGLKINCRRLTKGQTKIVVAAAHAHIPQAAIEQRAGALVIHFGGAL